MELTLKSRQIWLYQEVVDFRKSITGLSELVVTHFEANWNEGLFVFVNRHRDKLKLLAWHGNGFVLLYKQLARGKFVRGSSNKGKSLVALDTKQLSWLLAGLDWCEMSAWKTLEYDHFF